MYQDSNGYLWSGGYGGLSRFDGKVFQNYNRKNGLVDHNVNAIAADSRGAIFVGTNRGLSVLQGKKFFNYPDFEGLPQPLVTSFCRGYHHSMYIGTTRGLFMYRDEKVKAVKRFAGYKVNDLFNPDTNVIFAGTDEGLVIYGHNTFRVYNVGNGLASNRVNRVCRFRNYIAVGTAGGLSLFDLRSRTFVNYGSEHGLIDENISALVNQHDEFLWVGSASGLMRFDGKQFDFYDVSNDNKASQVRCLLNDREDNVWLGTHSGLYRYRDNSFTTFGNVSGLGTAFTFQVFRDRQGALWATSQNSGVFRASGLDFVRFGEKHGIPFNTSRAAVEFPDGRLFFGTPVDLREFRNNRFEKIPLPDSLKGPYDVLYVGKDQKLWIGGTNGFACLSFNGRRPSAQFYPLQGKLDFQVFGFCEDDSGALYIGTFKAGLYRLRGDSLVNISSLYRMNEENFFTLKYRAGKVFAASLNGVLVFDLASNTLKRITDLDGLNSELVYSVEFTRDGRYLWIGTNQGINRLDLRRYFENGAIIIESFGKQEGFAGVECNNGIWEDEDGTLWFGTVSGLIRHQPFNLRRNLVENNTLIQSVRLMNEDTLLSDSSWLPSDYNTVSFYYRGICLTNPDKVLYQRKLEGLAQDREWSVPTNENYIKYTNLAPGKYTFKVRSCNNEGLWNKKETSFTFFIRTPFYLTWWFILLAAFLLFSAIYAVFMFRIYNIKKKQRQEFERRVEMSKIELKALRSQMNPHFVFNSLNAIQHYIFNTKSDEAIRYLNKFARLVRIILNNSEKPTVTVGEDIEALKLYLELEQMRFEGKFDYEIIVEESVDPDYDIMPPLLMQPYVENAILHGLNPKPGKGKLTIRLHSENNFLICTITDNGIGRESSAEIRRTMPPNKHRSLGMKITEDRLRILNEINNSRLSVTVTDLKDETGGALGTRVELFVPLTG
jgi:ligand-binding sensor domain-containing protein